ncbi:MAG TPA: GAF domain-containing protein [Ramlibacter sp.]|nr:GAF domain-containing protein [Ramlibacter lithotrophicus]
MHDELHSAAKAPGSVAGRRAVLDAAHDRSVRMIQDGAPLHAILGHLATTAEALSGGTTVASILVLDGEGLLRNGASPNLPADYLDQIDRLKPDPKVGTCAAAAATGEIVLTPSFYADQRWAELRQLPLALGFLGAWSMPIKGADGRVLGTFGTYFREHREPTAEEREAVAVLAAAAAEAIEARAVATAD